MVKYKCNVFAGGQLGDIYRWYCDALIHAYGDGLFIDSMGGSINSYYCNADRYAQLMGVIPYDIVIHTDMGSAVIEPGKVNVAILPLKTTTVPHKWVYTCSLMDLIIVPSRYCAAALERAGICARVSVIPPPVPDYFTSTTPLDIGLVADHRFLFSIDGLASEGWVQMVEEFMCLFTGDDGVALILLSSNPIVRSAVDNIAGLHSNPPSVYCVTSIDSELIEPSIYSLATAHCSLPHGEPYGPSYMKSISCGRPVICTGVGGHIEYLPDGYYYAVPAVLTPAAYCPGEPQYDESLMWYKPRPIDLLDKQRMLELSSSTFEPYRPVTTASTAAAIDDALHGITARRTSVSSSADASIIVDVSIIIVSYESRRLLEACIESIRAASTTVTYEIIVIDNGSTDADLLCYLDDIGHDVNVIRSSINLGFGPANNVAARSANGRLLCFLNNDTEVTDHWLDAVVRDFDNDDRVGIVGAKLLYPNMTIQHAGIAVKQPGDFYVTHPFIGQDSDYGPANIRKMMVAVTGACMFIRAGLFDELGGFDPNYRVGYYEDVDLCLRAAENGYIVIYEPECVVIHKASQSFKRVTDKSFFFENDALFKRRWSEKITDNMHMFTSRHRYEPGRRNICVLNSFIGTLGGGERMTCSIAALLEPTHNVDIVSRLSNDVDANVVSERLGIELSDTNFVVHTTGEPLRYLNRYDVFINTEWGSCEPGFADRNILYVMFPAPGMSMRVLDSYDKVLAISRYVSTYIGKYWGVKSTVVYPPVSRVCEHSDWDRLYHLKYTSKRILSVGRFFAGGHNKKHMVLIDAFKGLVDNHSEFADWELCLVGGLSTSSDDVDYFNQLVSACGDYNIKLHANVDHCMLRELYMSSTVYWHATGYGETDPAKFEHFGIAPVEALTAGCVPVLFNGGGLVEIVDRCGGALWSSISELIECTINYRRCSLRYPFEFTVDAFNDSFMLAIGGLL